MFRAVHRARRNKAFAGGAEQRGVYRNGQRTYSGIGSAVWGEFFFTADTLADSETYNERDWGIASYERALQLCFDAAVRL